MIKKIKFISLFSILAAGLLTSKTFAATINFTADRQNVNIGDNISVALSIDTKGVEVNAAQGIVHFSEGVLQLTSVDRTGSAFNFWVEDPNISNNVGTMSFTGGTTQGISGSSVSVLTMKFHATGSGSSSITFSDGAVTANDGLGTNVLSSVNKADISVSGAVSAVVTAATTTVLALPQPVIRTPVAVSNLPVKPTVEISSYPDETRWYNQINNVIVFWNVPKDVIAVAASIDKNPNSIPAKFESILVDGKDLGKLNEGIWYAHVRFKNNIGLGPVATHKISLDATPPLDFQISSSDDGSDNPSPTLTFRASDSLSGIDYYSINIDNQESIRNTAGLIKLFPQEPGDHIVKISAYDKAGNSTSASTNLKIAPIESPKIGFVSQPVYSDTGDNLRVSGSALAGKMVLLSIVRLKDGLVAANGTARVDEGGQFAFVFEDHFDNGSYKVIARTQDDRGALSLPVELSLTVKSKPVLTVGFFELSFNGLIILLILILIASFVSGYYFYKFRREKSERRTVIAKRDLFNVADLLKTGIETLKREKEGEDGVKRGLALKELEENVDKLNTYIKKEVEGIRK